MCHYKREQRVVVLLIKTYKVLYADITASQHERLDSLLVTSLSCLVQSCLTLLEISC